MAIIESQALTLSGLISRTDQSLVPLLGVKIPGEIKGLLCDWRVTQKYRNNDPKPIEALYLFPLQEDSTVCGLTVTIGKKILRAAIEERDTAFEAYDRAMENGDGAFLLDQERPNIFQMSVGNLLPNEEATIEIRYLNLARPSGNTFRLMLPTTISPRYTPISSSTEEKAEIERITPDYSNEVPYGLSLSINAVMSSKIIAVESPSHPVRSEVRGKNAKIELCQTHTSMDRDVVISIETAKPREPGVFSGRWKDREYLLLELYPEIEDRNTQPKSVAFLIDCSGSMQGTSIEQAKKALELCLRGLNIGDSFQIIRFGSTWQKLFPVPLLFDQATLEKVLPLISRIGADLGGTEIVGALNGLTENFREGQLDLIIMTDGEVSNENEVILWAERNRRRIRVFSFGIGAGASEFLINGLARKSNGAAEFIFPGERIEPKVLKQFGRLSVPAFENLKLSWGVASVDQAPEEIPPVFSGSVFLASARLPENKTTEKNLMVTLSGKAGSEKYEWSVKPEHCRNGEALAFWWARQAIRDLEEEPEKLQHGSNQRRSGGENRIVELSKEYGILSSETSFVAIEERTENEKSKERAKLKKIPILITSGWHGAKAASPSLTPSIGGALLNCVASAPAGFSQPATFASAVGGAIGGFVARARESFSGFDGSTVKGKQCRLLESLPSREFVSKPGGKEIPQNRSDQDWILDLLGEMQAEGYFRLCPAFERASGKPLNTLSKWAKKIEVTSYSKKDNILATALAIILFRTKGSNDEDLWRLAVNKAVRWLEKIDAKGEGSSDLFKWLEALLKQP